MTQLLENDYISLRPYNNNHIEKTVEWLSLPLIKENFGLVNNISVDSHKNWLDNNKEVIKWAIYSEKYIGNLFLFENARHKSAYFQIYIGATTHIGKGIGGQALNLMLNYAFTEKDIHRVWMHCYPTNLRAIKLYEKLGFVFEGMERESIYKNEKFISQGRWSILKHEWQSKEVLK
ncbi:MAG: GNAT family N-acetyltransferase [Candidatus Berkiella sp.]